MSNGRTNFEHMLDRKNPFEARSLGVGKYLKDAHGNHILDEAGNKIKQDPKYFDSMGHEIMDANSQRIGETAKYTRGSIESSAVH
jgi:hypothetical protein